MRKFALVILAGMFVAGLNLSGKSGKKNISGATLTKIGQLYIQQGRSLDSFLQEIPKYFYNSSYDAKHLYDRNIFNSDYFAPGKDAAYSSAKAQLGQLLFFDPILSDNNKRTGMSLLP